MVFQNHQKLLITYKLSQKNELAVLRWVADKYADGKIQTVIEKLGYDAIVKKDSSVTFFNAGNILDRGVNYKYGEKRSDNYSSLVRRNVSNDTIQKLQEYVSKNGRGLETLKDQEEYAKLVRETFSYSLSDFEYDGKIVKDVKIINEDVYTPLMKSLVEYNNKIGIKTRFALRLFDDYEGKMSIAGLYSPQEKEITLFVDTAGYGGDETNLLAKVSMHELFHALSDKLHVRELIDRIYHLGKYPNKKEWNNIVKKYEDIWKYKNLLPEERKVAIEEEILANVFAGSQKLSDTGWVDKFRDKVFEIYNGGTRSANNKFYKILAEEEDNNYSVENRIMESRDVKINDNPEGAKTGLAVTYSEKIDLKDFNEKMAKLYPVAIKLEKKLNSLLKLSPETGKAIGGWAFTENANKLISSEPSFPLYFKSNSYKDIKDVILYSCLMADLAYESQNSTLVWEYADKSIAKNNEIVIPLKKVNEELINFIKDNYDGGFTLPDKGNEIIILTNVDEKTGLTFDGKTFAQEIEKIEIFSKKLKERGFIDETREIKYTGTKNYDCDRASRANVYSSWLKGDLRGQKGSLISLVKQAQKINNYLLSKKDINGDIPESITRNSSEILSYLKEKQTKIISDLQAKSSTVLIEAGADIKQSVKYRLESVKMALNNVIKEVIPSDSKYKLNFGEVKQAHAELNLAKPKDRDTAITNIVKGLKDTKVILKDNSSVQLNDILTVKQENEIRNIVENTLKGKAEPTKLVEWSKTLKLQKLENYETKRHIVIKNRLERRIASSKTLNFGYGDAPRPELTVFENIFNTIPNFWNNKSVISFADSVLANYNQNNIGKLFDNFGVAFDENIIAVAENLKSLVESGKHLDPRVQVLADDLLTLLYSNLQNIDSAVKSANVKMAERDANIVQSMFYNGKHNGGKAKVKSVARKLDNSMTAPVDFLNRTIKGTELQRFVNEDTGIFENKEIELNNKYEKLLFKDGMSKEVEKLLRTKFEFNGEKITYGQALDRLNSAKTLGEKFFNAKGTLLNDDGTRKVISYSRENIIELENKIPQSLLDWNNNVLKILNEDLFKDIDKLYFDSTGTHLQTLDNGNIWYNIARVTDNFTGITMGGKSFKDFNLSMFNKRVNSRADLNFDLDIVSHLRNYIKRAFKTLVWQPYVNKINTLLNTRIYGSTLNKILEQNIVGYKEEMDLLFHQITGVPYETKVSTTTKITGKVVGNLNAVRVATIQAGLRTLSSAPYFAKYFGGNIAIRGIVQDLKNGSILAIKKNWEIIKKYSPSLAKRIGSDEVFLAQTGLKVGNKITKIFGSPLRWGDALVHLTTGFAMAQVKAQDDGFGLPYSEENNKMAMYLLEQASKETQPTNAIGHVAGFRYGNSVFKYLFGLYGSMKQAFYDGLASPLEDLFTYKSKLSSIEDAIKEHEKKIAEYSQKAQKAEEDMNTLIDEEYQQAKKDYEDFKRNEESHRRAKENTEEQYERFKNDHTSKKMFDRFAGSFGGLIFASLLYVAISNGIKVAEGKKRISDIKLENLPIETLEQAFLNSMPYLSTIYNSIKNNGDLSIATVDNINYVIDTVKNFVSAIESGNGGHIIGATLKMVEEISQFFGIPLQSMLKLVNGTWYNIDMASNLEVRNWLGLLSANKLKENYKNAKANGDSEMAKANLDVWVNNYSIHTSQNVLDELYRLNSNGFPAVLPTAITRSYTDEETGESKSYTSTQVKAYTNAYSRASNEIENMLKLSSYKSLDDEYKAKAIAKVYSVYKEYAVAKRDGTTVSGKFAKLLEATNGNIELAKYIIGLQELSNITETKNKTRKDNVISTINKMKNFTKAEKLLLAFLSGYSISENNKFFVQNFLIKLGFDRNSAKEYIS